MAKLTDNAPPAARDLKPGETRTYPAKDKQGNVIKTITVYRTERDYVFDLCDAYNAYNAARTAEAVERGLQWFVSPSGELKLGNNAAWSRANLKRLENRNEDERARHNRLTYQPGDA